MTNIFAHQDSQNDPCVAKSEWLHKNSIKLRTEVWIQCMYMYLCIYGDCSKLLKIRMNLVEFWISFLLLFYHLLLVWVKFTYLYIYMCVWKVLFVVVILGLKCIVQKTLKNRYDDKQYFLKHSLSINYFQGINYQQQYPYRPCSGEKSKHMPICWTHKGQRYIKWKRVYISLLGRL